MPIHDTEISNLIHREIDRQQSGISLIPSENHTSKDVLEALATVFSDKYAEGYPGKRYYAGNAIVDELESLVQERAKKLFHVPYVNVQPYSGSPANLAILLATLEPGDAFMGLELAHGGHLTHGYERSATGRLWKSIPYHVLPDGSMNFDELRENVKKYKPKLIICGGTAIPRRIPFQTFAEIADESNALLLADISHIAGLIAGGQHESPVPYAHIVMTTTHKTLRGPRGALIMVTEKGQQHDPELPSKMDRAIIPGLQGGPHMNTIAGIGVALKEAAEPSFAEYAKRITQNAHALSKQLIDDGFSLVSGGTDTHLILIDLTPSGIGRGVLFQDALERIGVATNKNTIPLDPSTPFYPSGLRLGTPAVTTRGMTQTDMKTVGGWIKCIADETKHIFIPNGGDERKRILEAFRLSLETNEAYSTLREEVRTTARHYPIPGV